MQFKWQPVCTFIFTGISMSIELLGTLRQSRMTLDRKQEIERNNKAWIWEEE